MSKKVKYCLECKEELGSTWIIWKEEAVAEFHYCQNKDCLMHGLLTVAYGEKDG